MVRILQAARIAADGINSKWYPPGEVLDLPDALSGSLIRSGIAEDCDLPSVEQPKALAKAGKKQEYRAPK